jgi:hypothetical protein
MNCRTLILSPLTGGIKGGSRLQCGQSNLSHCEREPLRRCATPPLLGEACWGCINELS